MNKTLSIIIGVSMLLMSGTIGFLVGKGIVEVPLGSVGQSGEYKYTQLTGVVATSSTAIKTSAGTLGSIIITEDSALAVDIWDATSTAAVKDGNTSFITKVADLQAALTEGTYTFDVSVYKGLILDTGDWAIFAGDWTVTWR